MTNWIYRTSLDLNDDGQITDIDRDYCGSPWAKMQMSLVLNAEWKNFDFSMMWNGQFGNKIYNVSRWQGRLFADNSNYIRYLFKTVRKFFGEAVVVTQEVEDIISSPIVKGTIIREVL